MSRRGYGFERETEIFLCALAEQDTKDDFAFRSFRTATSGAATSSKGDVRMLHVPWLKPLTLECKHLNDYSKFGPTFHLYTDWLKKVCEEATATRAIPGLTWAFKHARTHRGQGRVQFAFPVTDLITWSNQAGISFEWERDKVKYMDKKIKYFLVYHDELWKLASGSKPVVFLIDDVLGTSGICWGIISRRHIQMIFEAIREKWKLKEGIDAKGADSNVQTQA